MTKSEPLKLMLFFHGKRQRKLEKLAKESGTEPEVVAYIFIHKALGVDE